MPVPTIDTYHITICCFLPIISVLTFGLIFSLFAIASSQLVRYQWERADREADRVDFLSYVKTWGIPIPRHFQVQAEQLMASKLENLIQTRIAKAYAEAQASRELYAGETIIIQSLNLCARNNS